MTSIISSFTRRVLPLASGLALFIGGASLVTPLEAQGYSHGYGYGHDHGYGHGRGHHHVTRAFCGDHCHHHSHHEFLCSGHH